MTTEDLAARIGGQFSGESDRADVWRALSYLLDTDAFLNLGYSPGLRTHLVGDPQRRLVELVVDRLAARRQNPRGERLLDVGCGRGVPTAYAGVAHGFEGVGVDLVRHNLRLARENVAGTERPPSFVTGDATALPIRSGSVAGCVAIDSIVYVPDVRRAYAELARVLEPGGHAVVSDLVVRDGTEIDAETLVRFGRAWDTPEPPSFGPYVDAIASTELAIIDVTDLSPHSVAGFRKWTTALLGLLSVLPTSAVASAFERADLDPAIVDQLRAAHAALPALRHVLVTLRRPVSSSERRTDAQ